MFINFNDLPKGEKVQGGLTPLRIILTSLTSIPKEFNHVDIVLVLISFVLPDNTSLPMIIIPAIISFLFFIYKYK